MWPAYDVVNLSFYDAAAADESLTALTIPTVWSSEVSKLLVWSASAGDFD